MALWSRDREEKKPQGPILVVENLDVYYGRAHALQGVSFTLDAGVFGIVGRNGMGKTTLCNAITGLVKATGRIVLAGESILGLAPNQITQRGIAYVPQGRRVWPSLSVDETLRLVAPRKRDIERIYTMFPRLAERKGHGGAQLSGGEQQMLAIGRALLLDPKLLVMDEPTEGLAPVIVEQVEQALRQLAHEGEIAVLLIEQNLGVAMDVAHTVHVMVNGRIARSMPAAELARDRELAQQLLGVRMTAEESIAVQAPAPAEPPEPARVFTIRRAGDAPEPAADPAESRTVRAITRWNAADATVRPRDALVNARAEPPVAQPSLADAANEIADAGRDARVFAFPAATSATRAAYVAGTFDTKGRELLFLKSCLDKLGVRTVTVDLSTSGKPSPAMVHPREVARHHPRGERAVFTDERGTAVTEMGTAFANFLARRRDVGGVISAGGSGGTALATTGMRSLPIGIPKVMVSTVASGDVKPYVGPSDICMMYSVTDIAGINRISEKVLANAAHALAGMVAYARSAAPSDSERPAIGLTMFGLTTACVQAVTRALEADYDCLVFHATGTGGQSMEKLVDSGLLAGVIDVTTTEIADEIAGGVLSAGPSRLDAIASSGVPYVGSCGALDMVNFWSMDSVPERYRGRLLHRHNANVTLMRTTPEECVRIGRFLAEKLNRMSGPVRFLIPEGGVSGLDAPGRPFFDAAADKALFDTLAAEFRATADRRLVRLPHHINDDAFAAALVGAFREVARTRAPAFTYST
jgi:uncharacterized protein (UPF0261 family)/ABC-type branched-subunit amino acid transport system ATPase component